MKNMEVRRQFFATISANLMSFNFGMGCAWANANFLDLQSPLTKLPSGPITSDEAALMVSLISLGGLLGNIVYLWVVEKFGRKKPTMFLALPSILSWLLVIFAKNVIWLYASRLLCGFAGGACFICVPIFVTEICFDSIRGTLGSVGFLACTLGSLIGFFTANYMDYEMQAKYALFVPILFVFIFSFVPETPEYLRSQNKTELSEMALEFYKGVNLPEMDKFMVTDKSKDEEQSTGLSMHDFVGTRAARRALFIAIILSILPQLCGCYILLNYTTAFFAEAGSNLTPIQSSILICLVQLAANIITIFCVDKIGRKVLFVSSSVLAALGMLTLAMHRMYRDELPESNWVPMYVLAFTIFIGSLGLLPVPYVITIDVLPPKIRNVSLTLTSLNSWILGFGTNIAYLYLIEVIKLHGCLFLFAGGSLLCALYALIFIPETKGKSNETIIRLLDMK